MIAPLRHILCVDDEEDILRVARLSLEKVGGFQVSVCNVGKEAVPLIRRLRPDLVLLDVMMPDIDGPGVLKMIRADPEVATTPVIFMTAKVQPSEVAQYLALGASGAVPKPFDPMSLSAQIRELWDRLGR